jgi:hypothetical protein
MQLKMAKKMRVIMCDKLKIIKIKLKKKEKSNIKIMVRMRNMMNLMNNVKVMVMKMMQC